MPLVDIQLHLLIRLVELAGLAPRAQRTNRLFKNLHRLKAALPFVTFDVEFNPAVRGYCNFKFTLWHKVLQSPIFCFIESLLAIPVAHLESDGLVLVNLLLDDHKLAGPNFLE